MQRSFTALIFCLFIIAALTVSSAFAQQIVSDDENTATKREPKEENSSFRKQDDAGDSYKKNELSVWTGFAPNMPRVFGGSRKSSFAEVGFRYTRHLIGGENLALKYYMDVIPFAAINYRRDQVFQSAPNAFFQVFTPTKAYAFGFTPVGFKLNFSRKSKVQPFITADAGLLIFSKTIPDDRSPVFPIRAGKKLNFTLAGGGGLEYLTDSGRSYLFGFKFHHISNASTGEINPGFDQNLFWFGYTFKKW